MLLQQRLKQIRSEKTLTVEQLALLIGIPEEQYQVMKEANIYLLRAI